MKKNKALIFAGIGIELVGLEVTLIFFGRMLDQKYGWPGFAVAGLGLSGLVFWLWQVVRLLKNFEEEDEE